MRLFSTAIAAVLCVAASVFSGCSRRDASHTSDVLRISQRNEPSDLDPATATLPDDFFIIRALSEGLVTPDPAHGTPHAAAAASWDMSADGLVYTFHLRPDAKWSNGDPVTADDFVASYRRVLDPRTAAPKAPLLFMVKNARAFSTGSTKDFATVGFRAADPATLVVTLEHPQPHFLAYVASGPWIPVNPRVVARLGRAWTRPGNFVGNGPFVLKQWMPHQRIVVQKSPGYHGAASIDLEEIQFIAFDNGESEERAYRAGQVDVTMAVPYTKLSVYQQERPDELHRAPLAETRYLSFNTQRPALADVRVRRALSLAVDRVSLTDKVLRGGQQPANRLVPPALRTTPASNGAHEAVAAPDLDAARALLAQAGFPNGKGFPRLEISTWFTGTSLCEAIQEMWRKELGIEVSIVSREAKVHLAALAEGNYDIAFITSIPDVADPASIIGEFVTGAPGNYPHWSNPAYDRLVYQARRATDPAEEARLLDRAESLLLEECPLTPLYYNTTNWLMRPEVQGWRQDGLWTRFYDHLSIHEKK